MIYMQPAVDFRKVKNRRGRRGTRRDVDNDEATLTNCSHYRRGITQKFMQLSVTTCVSEQKLLLFRIRHKIVSYEIRRFSNNYSPLPPFNAAIMTAVDVDAVSNKLGYQLQRSALNVGRVIGEAHRTSQPDRPSVAVPPYRAGKV